MSEQGDAVGTEEGQTADVTTPRDREETSEDTTAEEAPEKTSEPTSEPTAETAGDSGLDNDPLQAGAEPELGSEVD